MKYQPPPMEEVYAWPPNARELEVAFPGCTAFGTVFSWGDKIYNPYRILITPELMAHEAVHGERQGPDPWPWWRKYIADPRFRLGEEIMAHRVEYAVYCMLVRDRNNRDRFLHRIALRLASSLYGQMIPYNDARRAITQHELHAKSDG